MNQRRHTRGKKDEERNTTAHERRSPATFSAASTPQSERSIDYESEHQKGTQLSQACPGIAHAFRHRNPLSEKVKVPQARDRAEIQIRWESKIDD